MSKHSKSRRSQNASITNSASSTPAAPMQATVTPVADPAKSNRQLRREAAAAHARTQRMKRYAILAVIAVIAMIGIGLIVREIARPKPGEAVAIVPSDHIAETAPAPQYNSNPPTSGPHFGNTARQGFYPADTEAPKDGNLIHNLEHGHIVMYYDCAKLHKSGCETLQSQLQGVISATGPSQFTPTKKVSAVPRKDFGAQIALTSWGRILKLDAFDEAAIKAFIAEWREKSPEPQAS